MIYIKQFLYAFLSTIGFSVLFNIPKETLLKSGIGGATGWIVFVFANNFLDTPILGAFFGAFTVGIIGELLATKFRKPATVFIVPGIVPLVPGAGMYYTMLSIIEKDFYNAASAGSEAIFIAIAISTGIIISSSISRVYKNKKRKTAL